MLCNIDLNPTSGTPDIVNIWIVYRFKQNSVSPGPGNDGLSHGLFGHDNGGFDKFIAFEDRTRGNLVILRTTGNSVSFGPNLNAWGKMRTGPYLTNADASVEDRWICLSVHWDIPGGNDASACYCNGAKLGNFMSRTSVGYNKMVFGDLNINGKARLEGDIAYFALIKGRKLPEQDILACHRALTSYYAITPVSGLND